MITASEVPTARCIRIASSTPCEPNSSYSTGTRMPPPPIPSRPASSPVTKPAASRAAEQQRELAGRNAEVHPGNAFAQVCP